MFWFTDRTPHESLPLAKVTRKLTLAPLHSLHSSPLHSASFHSLHSTPLHSTPHSTPLSTPLHSTPTPTLLHSTPMTELHFTPLPLTCLLANSAFSQACKRQYVRVVTSQVSVWYSEHSTANPAVSPSATIVYGNKFARAE
jgi:hypothetical protein